MKRSTIFGLAAGLAMAATATVSAQTMPLFGLNPENGSVVDDLMTIQLYFPNSNAEFFENNRMPVATLENITTGDIYYCQEADVNPRSVLGTEYTLVFIPEGEEEAEPIKTPGEYYLSIRSLYETNAAGDNLGSFEINAWYTIQYPVAYYFNPTPGVLNTWPTYDPQTQTILEPNLQTIAIVFPDANAGFFENNRMPIAVLEYNDMRDNPLPDDEVPNIFGQGGGGEEGLVHTWICEEPVRNTFYTGPGVQYIFNFIEEGTELSVPITGPGNYTLTVKSLVEIVDGEMVEALPPITAYYTINYPYPYVLMPNNRSMVDVYAFSNLMLEFPYNPAFPYLYSDLYFYQNNKMPVAVLENLTTGKNYVCWTPERNKHYNHDHEGVMFTFPFYEEGYHPNLYPEDNDEMNNGQVDDAVVKEFEVGTYRLTIKGIGFWNGTQNNLGDVYGPYALPVITAYYSVKYPFEYELNPVEGAVVSEIGHVDLTFPILYGNTVDEFNFTIHPNPWIRFYENSRQPVATLENLTTGSIYTCNSYVSSSGESKINVVPVYHSLDEADQPNATDPSVEGLYDAVTYQIYFSPEDVANPAWTYNITENGYYKLTINSLYAILSNEQVSLPPIYAYYIVDYGFTTGIDITKVIDEDNYNVYNMNGIQLIKNGKAEDVNNLGAGIYIINGKKVVIRK